MQVFAIMKLDSQNKCKDETVDLMSSTLPTKERILDFHPANLFLIFSMIGLQSCKLRPDVKSDKPRYVDGKLDCLKFRVLMISFLICMLQFE